MVRRGSTVRVRQRALQKPRKTGLLLCDRLAGAPVCSGYGAVYGAFRSRTSSAVDGATVLRGEKGRVAFGPETGLAGRTLNAQTLRAAQQGDVGPAAR